MKLEIEIAKNARFLNLKMLQNDELLGFIGASKNYKKFSMSKYNRELKPSHARNLLSKLRKHENVKIEPIIVDSDFNIVDGQHRFWALSKMKLPIPYIIDSSISVADTVEINGNQKPLSFMNYIKINVAKGNKNYESLYYEIQKFNKYTTAAYIAKLFYKGNESSIQSGGFTKKAEMGQFKFNYEKQDLIESFLIFIGQKKEELHKKNRLRQSIQETIFPFFSNREVDNKRLFKILTPELMETFNGTQLSMKKLADAYNWRLRSNAIKYNFYSKNNKDHFEFID